MKSVKAILWRKLNKASLDSLRGISSGQYHITLGTLKELEKFLNHFPQENPTDKGGYEVNVALAPFVDQMDDENSVGSSHITIRFMGHESARKDWNIRSQRPDTAYPLWRVGRRLPDSGALKTSYICIIRATDDTYHGRLILEDEFENLPLTIKERIEKSEFGIHSFESFSSQAEKIYQELLKNYNILLYGPPGTGKTTIMQEVVRLFNTEGLVKFDESKEANPFSIISSFSQNAKSIWTTFHQSYSYEEFIIGLSTEGDNQSKLLSITPKPGILLELSEFARKENNSSLLIIDELNRGNVSRIFGEFITLIEPDKRLNDEGKETLSTVKIRLPYIKYGEELDIQTEQGVLRFKNPYTMPKKLYTLASMNSIDKSTFPLDSALRRRFYRYDIMPDLELLASKLKINLKKIDNPKAQDIGNYSIGDLKKLGWKLLENINKKITIFLGKDYTLGHSYMWTLTNEYSSLQEAIDELINIFCEKIYPQLEELFRGRTDILNSVLKIDKTGDYAPFDTIIPSEEDEELGATISFNLNREKFSATRNPEKVLEWFQAVSEISIRSIDNSKDSKEVAEVVSQESSPSLETEVKKEAIREPEQVESGV